MNAKNSVVDLNDLVFLNKNKEYGAYAIRNLYNQFLTDAVLITVAAFVLLFSSPLIINYFKPNVAGGTIINVCPGPPIEFTKVSPVERDNIIKNIEAAKPLKATIAFRPPVIRIDDLVKDDNIPTQIDLQNSNPGITTQSGNRDGVDSIFPDFPVAVVSSEPVVKEEVFIIVEEKPSFPGGEQELLSYIASKIKYPDIAKRVGAEGKVFIGFVVSSSGAVTDVQVLKGIGAGCDEEAMRVIKSMPRWNPGKQSGRAVNVRISVPIIFRLQ